MLNAECISVIRWSKHRQSGRHPLSALSVYVAFNSCFKDGKCNTRNHTLDFAAIVNNFGNNNNNNNNNNELSTSNWCLKFGEGDWAIQLKSCTIRHWTFRRRNEEVRRNYCKEDYIRNVQPSDCSVVTMSKASKFW